MKKILFNWSGGKDSSLCLYKLLQDDEYDVCRLLTSVNEEKGRVSMHGTRKDLLQNQAKKIGLPLDCLMLPGQMDMAEYDQLMKKRLQSYRKKEIDYFAFGDIFLEDLRAYREKRLAEVNMQPLFPLWKQSTKKLARQFFDLGFKAVISAVDGNKLDKSFVGREYSHIFLEDLPEDVDPCGENGEFHSFVYDGPIFKAPVLFQKGEVVQKEYNSSQEDSHSFSTEGSENRSTFFYWFIDLHPASG